MKILSSLQEPTLCVHILLVCDVLNSGNHMPGTPLPCPAPAWTIDGYKWDTRLCGEATGQFSACQLYTFLSASRKRKKMQGSERDANIGVTLNLL